METFTPHVLSETKAVTTEGSSNQIEPSCIAETMSSENLREADDKETIRPNESKNTEEMNDNLTTDHEKVKTLSADPVTAENEENEEDQLKCLTSETDSNRSSKTTLPDEKVDEFFDSEQYKDGLSVESEDREEKISVDDNYLSLEHNDSSNITVETTNADSKSEKLSFQSLQNLHNTNSSVFGVSSYDGDASLEDEELFRNKNCNSFNGNSSSNNVARVNESDVSLKFIKNFTDMDSIDKCRNEISPVLEESKDDDSESVTSKRTTSSIISTPSELKEIIQNPKSRNTFKKIIRNYSNVAANEQAEMAMPIYKGIPKNVIRMSLVSLMDLAVDDPVISEKCRRRIESMTEDGKISLKLTLEKPDSTDSLIESVRRNKFKDVEERQNYNIKYEMNSSIIPSDYSNELRTPIKKDYKFSLKNDKVKNVVEPPKEDIYDLDLLKQKSKKNTVTNLDLRNYLEKKKESNALVSEREDDYEILRKQFDQDPDIKVKPMNRTPKYKGIMVNVTVGKNKEPVDVITNVDVNHIPESVGSVIMRNRALSRLKEFREAYSTTDPPLDGNYGHLHEKKNIFHDFTLKDEGKTPTLVREEQKEVVAKPESVKQEEKPTKKSKPATDDASVQTISVSLADKQTNTDSGYSSYEQIKNRNLNKQKLSESLKSEKKVLSFSPHKKRGEVRSGSSDAVINEITIRNTLKLPERKEKSLSGLHTNTAVKKQDARLPEAKLSVTKNAKGNDVTLNQIIKKVSPDFLINDIENIKNQSENFFNNQEEEESVNAVESSRKNAMTNTDLLLALTMSDKWRSLEKKSGEDFKQEMLKESSARLLSKLKETYRPKNVKIDKKETNTSSYLKFKESREKKIMEARKKSETPPKEAQSQPHTLFMDSRENENDDIGKFHEVNENVDMKRNLSKFSQSAGISNTEMYFKTKRQNSPNYKDIIKEIGNDFISKRNKSTDNCFHEGYISSSYIQERPTTDLKLNSEKNKHSSSYKEFINDHKSRLRAVSKILSRSKFPYNDEEEKDVEYIEENINQTSNKGNPYRSLNDFLSGKKKDRTKLNKSISDHSDAYNKGASEGYILFKNHRSPSKYSIRKKKLSEELGQSEDFDRKANFLPKSRTYYYKNEISPHRTNFVNKYLSQEVDIFGNNYNFNLENKEEFQKSLENYRKITDLEETLEEERSTDLDKDYFYYEENPKKRSTMLRNVQHNNNYFRNKYGESSVGKRPSPNLSKQSRFGSINFVNNYQANTNPYSNRKPSFKSSGVTGKAYSTPNLKNKKKISERSSISESLKLLNKLSGKLPIQQNYGFSGSSSRNYWTISSKQISASDR